MRVFALLLVLLLVTPVSMAGTEADPEVVDTPDQPVQGLDLLSAWFENTWGGVRFTVAVRGLDGLPSQKDYFVGFDIEGVRHLAYISFDAEGQAHSIFARPGFGKAYTSRESYPDTLKDVKVRIGTPAYVSATIPWGVVPGFEPGEAVSDLYAGTEDGSRSDGEDYVDLRFSEKTFVLDRVLVPAGIPSGWATWGIVAVAAVAGGAGALFLAHRKHAAASSRPPAPPPGEDAAGSLMLRPPP